MSMSTSAREKISEKLKNSGATTQQTMTDSDIPSTSAEIPSSSAHPLMMMPIQVRARCMSSYATVPNGSSKQNLPPMMLPRMRGSAGTLLLLGIPSSLVLRLPQRLGDVWTQQAKLVAADGDSNDAFGTSVAISSDEVLIGAPKDEETGRNSGSAYIFTRVGDVWTQQKKLTASDPEEGASFGHSVSIHENRTIVGAPFRDGIDQDAGAAYTFLRAGANWVEQGKLEPQKLKKGEQEDLTSGDNFGSAIAIDGSFGRNESFAAIGSRWDNVAAENDRGSVYIYDTALDLGIRLPVEPSSELLITTLGQVKRTALFQNFPNPFNPETWLPYMIAADAPVAIRIYDTQGKLVRQLDIGTQKAGVYLSRETAAYWDGKDQLGEAVSSGIYFYTLMTGDFQGTRRMVILK